MGIVHKEEQRLLLCCCSFTCIYFPGILILLKFNDSIYNIGTYKFIPILLILMFAEVIKLSFSLVNPEPTIICKIDSRSSSRSKKSWTKNLKELVKFILAMFVLLTIYYIVIVLFGAPILTHHEETIMLALTLTSLTFVPATLHLGVDTALNILMGTCLQKGNIFMDAIKMNIKVTILGTWLGAIVIPLDWDRPWQVWPIPCIAGALIGYVIAHFITLIKTLSMLKLNKKLHQ